MTVERGSARTCLAQFAAEHGVALTRFAYLLCGDRGRAQDLVQDTYLALYRRFGDELPIAAPVAYARRAIVHAQVSRARRRSSTETPVAELPEPAAVDPTVAEDEQDAMWRALATLPERQRTVLVLRYYADLPDSEIARLLGVRRGTVRSLATRAFAELRHAPQLAATSIEDQP
jgi:RNA polymerase sigma-70 factor (sigma-E family)